MKHTCTCNYVQVHVCKYYAVSSHAHKDSHTILITAHPIRSLISLGQEVLQGHEILCDLRNDTGRARGRVTQLHGAGHGVGPLLPHEGILYSSGPPRNESWAYTTSWRCDRERREGGRERREGGRERREGGKKG